MIKNVQNPVEYYKNHTISYGSASWIWRCENPRCRVRFPFWGQKKFDQMFDKNLRDNSHFKFKTLNGKQIGFFDWFKSEYHKKYTEAYNKHIKVFPNKLTGNIYSYRCKNCRMVTKFKDVIVDSDGGASIAIGY